MGRLGAESRVDFRWRDLAPGDSRVGCGRMLLIIDNYGSFTYNLVQYFGELGAEMKIFRNDQITVDEIRALRPSRLCISPGPCYPSEAGISCEVIRTFGASLPTLGVCLGHQAIGEVYGGEVVRAPRLMHGKTSMMHHDGRGVFAGLPNPFEATRYHSLIVKRETLPSCLEVSATTDEGEIMGLRHREYPVHGVQFHPESILTRDGKTLLKNFLEL
jgi:anthranilate synthase/aminodeoxychorismate synthase-like glutamine amidotransferase